MRIIGPNHRQTVDVRVDLAPGRRVSAAPRKSDLTWVNSLAAHRSDHPLHFECDTFKRSAYEVSSGVRRR
jgi:hypothetical protein